MDLKGLFSFNLIAALLYFLHIDSYTVSDDYGIMSHDSEFPPKRRIPHIGCYLDDVTALDRAPGLFLTPLSSDKSHSGSRLQQMSARGFSEGNKTPAVEQLCSRSEIKRSTQLEYLAVK